MPARGGGSGGKRGGSRGGRGAKPQRGSRSVPTEEEVLARNAAPSSSESSQESEEETEQQPEESREQRRVPAILPESDVGGGNPNRNPNLRDGPREPSRREKEAIEKAKQAALMQKLQLEGKTSRAKADLARLAEVRKRREEAERARAAGTSP